MATSGQPYDYTDSCAQCESVERRYRRKTIVKNLVVVHTDRATISAGKRSTEKKATLQKIERVISALRNTEGGQVLVHIAGQKPQDRYLEQFDEFITKSLSDLIEDGQTYVQAYHRRWLSELGDFKDVTGFLLLIVKPGAGIATVDFNTRFNNDIEKFRPQPLSIAEILFNHTNSRGEARPEGPILRGLPDDVQQLHENRSIELKAFKPNPEKLSEIRNNTSLLVDYVWNHLKLKDNLTSMSKVPGGGSYFLGISEGETTAGGYRTKKPKIEGFTVPSVDELRKCILDKIKACVTVLGGGTFSEAPADLIKVHFHRLSQDRYVLEVAVRYFDGIVFYDKEGPKAYAIKDEKISRISKEEWLEKFEDRFKLCVRGNYM